MGMVVGRKERVGCMERVTWKLTLPYVKLMANENLLCDSRNSKGLCNNLKGWDGEGGSKRRGHIYTYGSFRVKAMAPHSSTVARKIPWTEEPGRLQSMGSRRVRHNWATSFSLSTFMHWRRKWQPTPVFLPGESHGRRSLVGCRLWGHTELDTTEAT